MKRCRTIVPGFLFVSVVAALGAGVAAPVHAAAPSAATCARSCLEGYVDTYLAALAAHDPARAPLADTVRITENGAPVAPGDGLWRTAASPTDYRIYVADVPAGQVAFIGTILQSDGKPLMLALRLKVAEGTIHEVEAITGAPFELPGSPLVAAPSPALSRSVPAAQRLSRAQMIAVAERNFDGILAADGSHFALDCQRVENRMAMSGNPQLDYPIATLPGRPKPAFAAMGCQEQVESHLFDTLDSVGSRRYLVIDEERQLVFGVFMLNWYRDTRCNEVRNYGRVCRPEGQQPTGLRTAEILRVTGGQVHEVEVVFSFAPYEAPSGWESAVATRDPKLTEVWFPVPPKVAPGAAAGAPPSDAIVLFGGSNLDAWKSARGGDAKWTVANGELVVAPGAGDIQTRASFGDIQLHVEWIVPDLPASKVDQDRGNSGIFLQDVYEVQVLDNFTNPTYVNGMVGSVYKQFAPLVNAARPAEQWQTYDIIWTAPRFAADGSLASPARVTVLLNGVLVQNNAVLQGATTYIGAPSYRAHGDMPIRLQDHAHLVRYRNIWVRRL